MAKQRNLTPLSGVVESVNERRCANCGAPLRMRQTRFCGRRCAGHAAGKQRPTQFRTYTRSDAVRRFWSYVDKNGPVPAHRPELGACWVWTGGRSYGYGCFWADQVSIRAHRFSWQLATRALSATLNVLHACDNPPCVNPAHLFIGSHADNAADREAKGRGRWRRQEIDHA